MQAHAGFVRPHRRHIHAVPYSIASFPSEFTKPGKPCQVRRGALWAATSMLSAIAYSIVVAQRSWLSAR